RACGAKSGERADQTNRRATGRSKSAGSRTHPGACMNIPLETYQRALLENLTTLHAHLRELTALAQRKLTAVRSADAAALQLLAQEEAAILTHVERNQAQRDAAMARIAQALRRADARCMPLHKLADTLPEPMRSALLARGAALRAAGHELQRNNAIVAKVA